MERKPLRGVVLTRLNETSLILGIGVEHGVMEGMHFVIRTPEIEIPGPQGTETIRVEKARVKVAQVHQLACVCLTYDVKPEGYQAPGGPVEAGDVAEEIDDALEQREQLLKHEEALGAYHSALYQEAASPLYTAHEQEQLRSSATTLYRVMHSLRLRARGPEGGSGKPN